MPTSAPTPTAGKVAATSAPNTEDERNTKTVYSPPPRPPPLNGTQHFRWQCSNRGCKKKGFVAISATNRCLHCGTRFSAATCETVYYYRTPVCGRWFSSPPQLNLHFGDESRVLEKTVKRQGESVGGDAASTGEQKSTKERGAAIRRSRLSIEN